MTCKDTSFVPPLVYAFMGSSRDIAIGPVAVVSLLLGSMLQDVIDPKLNPEAYRRLAFTATFFAGITQLALGFLRYWYYFSLFFLFLFHAFFYYYFNYCINWVSLLTDWVFWLTLYHMLLLLGSWVEQLLQLHFNN